jgi:hypothetical protein
VASPPLLNLVAETSHALRRIASKNQTRAVASLQSFGTASVLVRSHPRENRGLPCGTTPQRQQGFFGGEMRGVDSLASASGWYCDPIRRIPFVAVDASRSSSWPSNMPNGRIPSRAKTAACRAPPARHQYQPDAPVLKLRTFSPRNCSFPRDFQHGDTPGDVLHIAKILRISISPGKMQKK